MQSAVNQDANLHARRRRLVLAAALVIVVGLVTHFLGRGPVADAAGDALYAVMIYLVVAAAFPRARLLIVGLTAAGICIGIELFQLTGLPGEWAETFWPVRLVLGVGFDVRDLIAYVVGVCAAMLGDFAAGHRPART